MKWSTLMVSILGTATLLGASTSYAKQVQIDVAMGQPVLLADKKQTAYLKVGLTGFEMATKGDRTPTNIALVLDRSGSMQGAKLKKAKQASADAIFALGKQDIMSVVTYDNKVKVLVPATKLTDKNLVSNKIKKISAGGSTALFAGVSKGADEVRKFLTKNRVNRVILLSDGVANVGPSSPRELANLGKSLAKEGISVSTIGLGLGYNEDLMSELARKSNGNHAFAESAEDLADIFNSEFKDALSVVAQEVSIKIVVAEGIRPVRVLGREAEIYGQTVTANINQLYSGQEKYILLEVEIPAHSVGDAIQVADVTVSYSNLETHVTDQVSSTTGVSFSDSVAEVDKNTDDEVMAPAVEQIAIERSKEAVKLRDEGKIQEAKAVLQKNAAYLGRNAKRYKSKKLAEFEESQTESLDNLDGANWNKQRKLLRKDQYKYETQQSY
ncbi:MAG: VWA domain-containing protein [Methylococcales bacterium]|jgi:Ca-activated chloride channel family protein|nr:VWA domain-containing protein [Methylococcales bacterium]MBT7443465.1 VWA domain-containing protein [Methylococcales bacterium]